jgi:hypothetical protein
MRQALNNNPKVQAGIIVVLLLLGVFMFMRMSGGEQVTGAPPGEPIGVDGAASTADAAGTTAAPAPATGATATAVPPAGATAVAIPSAPAAATGPIPPEALIPGPGLPADVAQAYARGNVIVLLLVKDGGTDDDRVKSSVAQISRPGVSVFVAPARQVARYSRIAQGAGVNRVPALIVVRPRSVSGATPQATVSYGFRELPSVLQAVEDALYRGRDDVPYHPG